MQSKRGDIGNQGRLNMNIGRWLTILTSSFVLKQDEKNSIMALTNELRDTINPAPVGMHALIYNDSFESVVTSFLNDRDPNWVFENSTEYHSIQGGPVNNWNGFVMMEYPEFKAWKPYCTFWLHDTMAQPDLVLNIFRFRLQQRNCFDWSACIQYPQLTNFLSCIPSLQQTPPNQRCEYTNQFLVRMLLNFDSAVVVGINHKGPYTPYPKAQLLSFWGWACSSTGIQDIPENGYPYEIAHRHLLTSIDILTPPKGR